MDPDILAAGEGGEDDIGLVGQIIRGEVGESDVEEGRKAEKCPREGFDCPEESGKSGRESGKWRAESGNSFGESGNSSEHLANSGRDLPDSANELGYSVGELGDFRELLPKTFGDLPGFAWEMGRAAVKMSRRCKKPLVSSV